MTNVTISQAIQTAQSLGLERLEAQLLALHVLGRLPTERAWLLAHGSDAMPEAAQAQLHALAARRARTEPLAYLTGSKEFYGLKLAVDSRVLDPRADTETLVDWALEVMDAWTQADTGVTEPPSSAAATAATTLPTVIDLGTGSGAIALALKHSRAQWQVHALDCSAEALAVARANATQLALDVQFHQGSWLHGLQNRFALIVSNPPYIVDGDPHLVALQHEPLLALASGSDGLDAVRSIVRNARTHLQPGGWLLLEHGFDQAESVRTLLETAGLVRVQSRRDLAGIERCSGAQNPPN